MPIEQIKSNVTSLDGCVCKRSNEEQFQEFQMHLEFHYTKLGKCQSIFCKQSGKRKYKLYKCGSLHMINVLRCADCMTAHLFKDDKKNNKKDKECCRLSQK